MRVSTTRLPKRRGPHEGRCRYRVRVRNLLTACDLNAPEEDVEEVRGFAIAPLEISPDELRAHQGETFAVDIVRGLPVVQPCFISGNEDAQPKCEDIMGEGWTLWTEKDLETLTMALDCGDLGPGGGTINLSDCWGLTVYERGTGPGPAS